MAKIRMERTPHSLITDGVMEHEQTLAAQKPFWVMFVANIGVATWLMGVLIAGMGFNFTDAMFVLLLGGIIGSALPAVMAILGPLTRLSQMEMGRFSLGKMGKKLPAFLNWFGTIGWDVVNNLLSAAAFIALFAGFGVSMPLWLALAVLVVTQMMVSIYGHHLIQDTSKYTGILLGLFFLVIGVIAIHETRGVPLAVKVTSVKDIFLALVLLIAYVATGWATYTADYTRYLPKDTPSSTVFFDVFAALFLSFFVLAFFGYMTASAVTEQTPEGVMKALQGLTGNFAPLVLFLVAFGAIPVNAVNDNSAAYCLISSGFKFTRPTSAIFGALLGYIVCLFASSSFVDVFENFLFFFAHWIAPWAAILLVHWFTLGKKERRAPSGITLGCVILVVVSAASIWLFSANSLYTGLLSDWVGGVDIGPYIGFVVAGLVYYVSLRVHPPQCRDGKISKRAAELLSLRRAASN
jgi:NCS1 family nucleobase:cation symporter-1